jgi:hypothetical protein
MPLTQPTYAVNNVQGLADLTQNQAAAVKVLFDKAGADTKTFIIALLAELAKTTAGSSAAENLGSATISGITGNTIHAQIANLLAIAQAAQAGTILPGTVTVAMLAFDPATQAELDALAGVGRATETVKGNADAIIAHQADVAHIAGKVYAYKNIGGF